MTPRDTFVLEMIHRRKQDKQWEQTREIMAKIHNSAGRVNKRNLTGKQIWPLSIDKKAKDKYPEWTKEEAEDLIRKWSN